MLKLGILKYWVIVSGALFYASISAYFPELMTWNTPNHIKIIINVVICMASIFFAIMILSAWSEDMMVRKDSFKVFGEGRVWGIWYWVYFPLMIISIYNWTHYGIMIASVLYYFGLKFMAANQNIHSDAYQNELIVRKARQEEAEKVTL